MLSFLLICQRLSLVLTNYGNPFLPLLLTDELDLSENNLAGTLTSQFHPLRQLRVLRLHTNSLEGDFNEIFDGVTSLGKFSAFRFVSHNIRPIGPMTLALWLLDGRT